MTLPRENGFTLTELAVVVLVIGLTLAGIWAAWSSVRLADQIRTNDRELTAIVENARSIFMEQSAVKGQATTLTPTLDQLRVFPMEMRHIMSSPVGEISHVWDHISVVNGLRTVQMAADDCSGNSAADNTTAYNCFDVTYYKIPYTACQQMIARSAMKGVGLLGIAINGNAMVPIAALTASAAQTNCAVGNNNTLIWVYVVKGG